MVESDAGQRSVELGRSVLSIRGLEKSFGAFRVLKGVDLDVAAGEVVVLMGANGAGKSTLVKVIAGVHAASGGTVTLDGRPYAPAQPADAVRSGLAVVHQSINDGVAQDLSVGENLLLDRLCYGEAGWLFWPPAAKRQAKAIEAILGLDLDLTRPVRDLPLADRQLVAIARALARNPKVLVLDEPTSSLSQREADRLFGIVERLKAKSVAILYISHRMSDIRRLADRIVTLRDGRITGTFATPLDYEGAVTAMLGHAVQPHGAVAAGRTGDVVFEVRDCRLRPWSAPFSVAFHEGEVTVIAGLVGTGKTEFAEGLFGLRKPPEGTLRLHGKAYAPKSPQDAIESGVFMAAKDRGTNSIVPAFDIAENLSLPFLKSFSALGVIGRGRERAAARRQIADMNVVCRGEGDPMSALSGGNQQKVVIARWLGEASRLLILDEPFQGVDIKARSDIGAKLRETAKGRATVLLLTELDEAIEVADRILVMSDHSIVGDHRIGAGFDEARVFSEIAGAARPARVAQASAGMA